MALWRTVSLAAMVLLMASSVNADTLRREKTPKPPERVAATPPPEKAGRSGGDGTLLAIGNLLANVELSTPTSDELIRLYSRHDAEINRIILDNPPLALQTLSLVLDLLPAVRSVDRNGGKLYVDKKTYTSATDLLVRCEALASPELAEDLRKARVLVDSKSKEAGPQQMEVDLGQENTQP